MNKTIQKILALCYMGLVIFGLTLVGLGNTLNEIGRNIYLILLVIFTIGFVCVLREEENEELKDN